MGLSAPSLSLAYRPICSIDFFRHSELPHHPDTEIIRAFIKALCGLKTFQTFILWVVGMLETVCKWHFGSTLVFLLMASTISDLISALHRAQFTFSSLGTLAHLSGALKGGCSWAAMECQSHPKVA